MGGQSEVDRKEAGVNPRRDEFVAISAVYGKGSMNYQAGFFSYYIPFTRTSRISLL